jgi:hypothetical protein
MRICEYTNIRICEYEHMSICELRLVQCLEDVGPKASTPEEQRLNWIKTGLGCGECCLAEQCMFSAGSITFMLVSVRDPYVNLAAESMVECLCSWIRMSSAQLCSRTHHISSTTVRDLQLFQIDRRSSICCAQDGVMRCDAMRCDAGVVRCNAVEDEYDDMLGMSSQT